MRHLAISPCPNDTFAFYGLLHDRVAYPTDDLKVRYLDIEALNLLCFDGGVDICKVSFHAYVLMRDRLRLLSAGSALGFGCGPLVVAKQAFSEDRLRRAKIAIPGRYTTAALLLKLWLGKDLDLVEMTFDAIMPAVEAGEVDAGLIIHESRFTYPDHGLVSVIDLGEWWEGVTGKPIPLGGIVARRNLSSEAVTAFDRALSASVDYAWAHPSEVEPFMRRHAQEMDAAVMQAHVNLYVNDYTRELGAEGEAAIEELVRRSEALNLAL